MAKGLTAPLESALKALEKQPTKALEQVVKAWVERPVPELGALIDRFEQVHPPTPFEGSTKEFLAAAKSPNAVELGTLARAAVAPKTADTIERLEALRPWARDPRVSSMLLRLLQDVPWTSDGARGVWTTVFTLVTRIADPRFLEAAKTLPGGWAFRAAQREWLGKKLEAAAAEVKATLEKKPVEPLSAAESKLLQTLGGKLVPRATPKPENVRSKEALLAEVYARPDDDAARLVYADWCLERSDPHGEFITLQFKAEKTAAELKQEAALLKKHAAAWLGPLAKVTLKGAEFRRGFPSKVTAKFKDKREAQQFGDLPEWSTVEDLSWSMPGAWTAELIPWQSYFPKHARPRAVSVGAPQLTHLLDGKTPWPIERLTIDVADVELLKRFAASKLFPNVRVLRVKDLRREVSWLTKGWVAKVPDLGGMTHQTELAPWLSALKDLPRFVVEHSAGSTFTFEKGKDGRLSKLHLKTLPDREGINAVMLKGLPKGLITELTTEGATPASVKSLNALLGGGGKAAQAEPVDEEESKPLAAFGEASGWRILSANRFERRDAAAKTVTHDELVNVSQAGAFSPDGASVVGLSGRRLEWRDGATGAFKEKVLDAQTVHRVLWSADGRWMLLHCADRLEVRDARSGAVVRTLKSGKYPKRPVCAALSPDGSWIAAPQQSGEIHLYAPGAAKPQVLTLPGDPKKNYLPSVAFFDDHHFVVSMRVGGVQVFDVRSPGEPVAALELPEGPTLIVSPTRTAAAIGDPSPYVDGQLTVVSLPSLKRVLQRKGAYQALAFGPTGDRLLVVTSAGLEVIDVKA